MTGMAAAPAGMTEERCVEHVARLRRMSGDVERTKSLVNWHERDGIDVHVWWKGDDVANQIGDVGGGECLHPIVDTGGTLGVVVEADERELGFADHSWLDVGDSYTGAGEVGFEVEAELTNEGLRSAINVPARVGIFTGDRAQINNDATTTLYHRWQQCVREHRQPGDVGGDHGQPVRELSLLGARKSQCATRVVDKDVDRTDLLDEGMNGGGVGDIEGVSSDSITAKTRCKVIETLLSATGNDELVAEIVEVGGDRLANARACAGNHGFHREFLSFYTFKVGSTPRDNARKERGNNVVASRIDLLIDRLRSVVDPVALILEAGERQAYSCDGLTSHRAVPALVVVPADRRELVACVREVIALGLPWVARGAGTGLSGGALPDEEGVLVVTSRLKGILEIDPFSRVAVVEPGVVNLELSRAVLPYGLYFAPDPSSQIACSIGGNVAENSGGAHCFKYGFTTHHVLALELLLPTGELLWLGNEGMDGPGPDLRGVVIGSEGTLGIVTRVVCRLLPLPEIRRTFLAYFDSVAAAAEAVSDVVSRGITPAAIEMMDQLAIVACEIATGAGLDTTAKSCLLLELDGEIDEVAQEFLAVRALLELHGSSHVWEAANEEERGLMWLARKAAFAAAGRVAPAYIVQDGVVPRSALPRVLERIGDLGTDSGLAILNVFHAGDGNLHPLVTYDPSVQGQEVLAEEVAAKILALCLEEGGSLTGEHGIGVDKVCHMPEMFSTEDLSTFERLRAAFDPSGMCNRGKLLPTPRLCGERPGRYQPHALEEAGLGERW